MIELLFVDKVSDSVFPLSEGLMRHDSSGASRDIGKESASVVVRLDNAQVQMFISSSGCEVFAEAVEGRLNAAAVWYECESFRTRVPCDVTGFSVLAWVNIPSTLQVELELESGLQLIGRFDFVTSDDMVSVVVRRAGAAWEVCAPSLSASWADFDGSQDDLISALIGLAESSLGEHSSRGRTSTSSELLRKVLRLDAELIPNRGKGSHVLVTRPGLSRPVPIPMHSGDLGKGLYRKIVKDLGFLLAEVENA
jgi:hypothetical protein